MEIKDTQTTQPQQKTYTCPHCGAELSAKEIKCRVCFSCEKVFSDESLIAQGLTLEKIKEISSTVPRSSNTASQNIFSYILKGVVILIIIIGVLSFIGSISSRDEITFLFIVLIFALGFFLMGVGEIIQILDDIRNK